MTKKRMSDKDAKKEIERLLQKIREYKYEKFYNFLSKETKMIHVVLEENSYDITFTPNDDMQLDVLKKVLEFLNKDKAKSINIDEIRTCNEAFDLIKTQKHSKEYVFNSSRGSPLFRIIFSEDSYSIIGETSPYMQVIILRQVWKK